jgi:sigma-B regulation protein RsbU (phosphoserine phosphatase)
MKILVAEDDMVCRRLLEAALLKWGYDVLSCSDGVEAAQILQNEDAPRMAILDWMMPGIDGVRVCQEVRRRPQLKPIYIIMLTARGRTTDIVAGLEAGADDYMTKPFHPEELQARLQVGGRIVDLQLSLADRVCEMENALSRLKQLQGLLPICSYCMKVRDDKNYWLQIESYVSEHSEAQFSHSPCPKCLENVVMGRS